MRNNRRVRAIFPTTRCCWRRSRLWLNFGLFNVLLAPLMAVFVLLDVLLAGFVVLISLIFAPLQAMRRYTRQFVLLMHKNGIVMMRRKLYTLVELGLPLVILPIVLLALKYLPDQSGKTHLYDPAIPVYGSYKDLDTKFGGTPLRNRMCGRVGNLTMLYYSEFPEARELMTKFSQRYQQKGQEKTFISVQGVSSLQIMMEMLRKDSQPTYKEQEINVCLKYFGGVVITAYNTSSTAPKLYYSIQMSSLAKVWNLNRVWDGNMYIPPRADEYNFPPEPIYGSSGIISVQRALDVTFSELIGKSEDPEPLSLLRAPTPHYFNKAYMVLLGMFYGLAALFLLFVVLHTSSAVLAEKESGMKAYLAVMGLTPSMFHFSHWTLGFLKAAIPLIVSIFPVFLQTEYSSPTLLAAVILAYSGAVASFCLLLASIMRSTSALNKWAAPIWLGSIVAAAGFWGPQRSDVRYALLRALNLNNAFSYAMDAFSEDEMRGQYLGWMNMFSGSSSSVTVGLALLMLIFDIIWMSLVTIYLDNVFPVGDSARKSALFFIDWIWKKEKLIWSNGIDAEDMIDGSLNVESEQGFSVDEADICVKKLTKVWDNNGERAVDSLSFRAYRGQVAVLLGHNGAGKSTTFSVISGITSPSTGSVKICNQEITTNLDECRQNIGYCPQTNPLFDFLTVREHLKLFQRLKRGADSAAEDSIEDIMRQVELMDKRHELARNLSGGMKRKLCVGMSLIGGSRVVLLDEPTAGMDPGARHTISELLERNKRDRTILLTTHYMDEADRLGDRIAIMVKGRLECLGSPEFLKRRFGAGYILSIDVSENSPNGQLGQKHTEAQLNKKVENIVQSVKRHIPLASLEQQQGNQIKIILPLNTTADGSHPKYASLFEDLENQSAHLSIGSFGLSLNSLEQVFLKVNEMVEPSEGTAGEVAERQASSIFGNQYEHRLRGPKLWFAQTRALAQKRFYYLLRHPVQFIFQILMPFLSILGFILLLQWVSRATDQAVTFDLDSLGAITMPLHNDSTQEHRDLRKLADEFSGISIREFNDVNASRAILPWMLSHPPVGIGFSTIYSGPKIGIYNGQALHAPVLVQNFFANAMLGVKDAIKFTLNVYQFGDLINPMEYRDMLSAVVVIISFSLLTSAFTMFVVEDRRTKFKHQQLLTRMHIVLYWLVMIVFDLLIYAFVCGLTLVVFASFKMYEGHLGAIVLLWVLYFFNSVAFIYCVSFLFESTERAYTAVSCWNTIAAVIALSFYGAAQVYMGETVSAILKAVFIIFIPSYGLGWGIVVVGMMSTVGSVGPMLVEKLDVAQLHGFTWDQLGSVITYMLISSAIFWTLLFMLQSRTVGRMFFIAWERIHKSRRVEEDFSREDHDEDVQDENARMNRTSDQELSLSVRSLNKYYGKLHAVRDLTFGVKKDECFGLLGVNGAGKTSTFDILTGVSQASAGHVTINGVNVNRHIAIGYCPQFDALLGDLTARQTLEILARLHGFESIQERVSNILECVELTHKADRVVRSLSGGQKRRLSIGVALLSQTPLMLLDEPTAGVDPRARRHIWNLLTAARAHNCAMLLTSHSMAECETLCGRVGFMHQGKLMRLGTPQHLKSKFGSGYQLSLTVEKSSDMIRDKLNAIVVHEMGAQETDTDADMPTYFWEIPKREGDRWSVLFKKLNSIIDRFPPHLARSGPSDLDEPAIRDSSLTQNSLEQVFLRFAQPEDEKNKAGAEGRAKTTKCPGMVNTRLRSTSSTEPIMGGGPTTSV
ncbi:hypothetical protein L596_024736 [Steinernema carpocapsae]|uniref:ABC transporter domain-containing protein n=1 Tax=Steinernema carpocapsae TaxID=34508 RepID=A0A4U5M5N2_STECR|nr:hypothetical protein L596_024736 [Steinernema carpocapsae]